ncbi:hypothetical protein CP532_0394 [Ophiocordyceps camponoti-leonardi (nom. inval.)]|nr:hypothetical protein CP532_0394 [Ophiocordyceps camponoti-leonardi (nom. inval.)]
MKLLSLASSIVLLAAARTTTAAKNTVTTDGIAALADRVLGPGRGQSFDFVLSAEPELWSRWHQAGNDSYVVSAADDGKIRVEGTSLSALARGLRHYATDTLQLDVFWFVGPGRDLPPGPLPLPNQTLRGSSLVPWRYNLNTVTFSYSFVWNDWNDWEKLLDWSAWRGINVQLAWTGYEDIFLKSFRAMGLRDDEIIPFFSGPAFQSWNRLGNVRSSWGGHGDLPLGWIQGQATLQRRIVARMVELGITPVLPAFPGFVPDGIVRVRPGVRVSPPLENWIGVPDSIGRTLFLSPLDDVYAELQRLFVHFQTEAYGNVSNIYTLDQFNEMKAPASEDALREMSRATDAALTAANPAAVWLMQGWLFFNAAGFWNASRVDAYLGGVADRNGLVVLDLFAESAPQWERTGSFAGRPWVWCMLHSFGGNMNLYGRATAVVSGPAAARSSSSATMLGVGLSPEGYGGNEVIYDLLLDQAWATTKPSELPAWFSRWAELRYAGLVPVPLTEAWRLLGASVYDCQDDRIPNAGVGVYQLSPRLSGLLNRTGHWPAPTTPHYNPQQLRRVWRLMVAAAREKPSLWTQPAFRLDMVDVTRQLLSNAFIGRYEALMAAFRDAMIKNKSISTSAPVPTPTPTPAPILFLRPRSYPYPYSSDPSGEVAERGADLLRLLDGLDVVCSAEPAYRLSKWLGDARRWAASIDDDKADELFAFNARSQITVWLSGASSLNDYSARAWAGLTRSYYRPRWELFVEGLVNGSSEAGLYGRIGEFERQWQGHVLRRARLLSSEQGHRHRHQKRPVRKFYSRQDRLIDEYLTVEGEEREAEEEEARLRPRLFATTADAFMDLVILSKTSLMIYCFFYRRFPSVHVFFLDHRNDIVVNVFGLVMSIAGHRLAWYLDPVGAICIALLILVSWSSNAFEQAGLLAGRSAPWPYISKLIYVTLTHSSHILKVDTCRAYHAGQNYYVEVDVVMDAQTPLRISHDVGQSLQRKLEGLADVERAFVHIDYEHEHNVHEEHKPLYDRAEPRSLGEWFRQSRVSPC